MCAAIRSEQRALDDFKSAESASYGSPFDVYATVKGYVDSALGNMVANLGPDLGSWAPGDDVYFAKGRVFLALSDTFDTWKWWLAVPTSDFVSQAMGDRIGAEVAMDDLNAAMKTLSARYHMPACK